MSKTRVWITLGCCLFATASQAHAQQPIKPGLWETTTSMSWQKSPFPSGMQMPPQAAASFGGGSHTAQSCLTQAWIDRFGSPMPQNHGACQYTNISLKPASMSGALVCIGQMNGSGTVEVEWSMSNTAKGKVHFTGAMQMGPNTIPIEWTNEFTSVYKGPDCGNVKPTAVPADK